MKSSGPTKLLATGVLAMATGVLAGCSLQPLPAEEMVQARKSIQAASAAVPAAGLEHARDKMALAQRWIAAQDHGPARWLAEQAEVDAELALARAAGNDARRALAQIEQSRAAVRVTSYPGASNPTEKTK